MRFLEISQRFETFETCQRHDLKEADLNDVMTSLSKKLLDWWITYSSVRHCGRGNSDVNGFVFRFRLWFVSVDEIK